MPIPNRRDDLQSFGYSFSGKGHCSGCGEEIEWWKTPTRKNMPFTVKFAGLNDEDEFLEPHWSTCPKADQYRRKK